MLNEYPDRKGWYQHRYKNKKLAFEKNDFCLSGLALDKCL